MIDRLGRSPVRVVTIVSDLLLANLAFAFAYVVRYDFQLLRPPEVVVPYQEYVFQQPLFTALLIVTFWQNRVWTRRRGEFWIDEISRVGYATATAIALMMAFTFFVRPLAFSRLLLVWTVLFTVLFIAVARLLRRYIMQLLYRRGIAVDRAIIVGSGEVGRSVIRTLLARPDLGFRSVGYLDEGAEKNNIGSARIPHLGSWTELATVLEANRDINTAFIALPSHLNQRIEQLLLVCQRYNVHPRVVPDLFQLSLSRVEFSNLAGIPLLSVRDLRISSTGQTLKRFVDLVIVALLAIPCSLITAVTALAIRLESPGPAFFMQPRVGYQGKRFRMAKFRSMVIDADDQKEALRAMNEASGPIFKIRDDPRLTRVGRVIRRLSLDEMPQLYNVLRGEMSLVGPRPPLAEEVDQYQPWHRQRLEVKGGITGLWQVSGRSDLTFDEQCLLDIYYIENWSLALDVRILMQTLPHVLFGRGAY